VIFSIKYGTDTKWSHTQNFSILVSQGTNIPSTSPGWSPSFSDCWDNQLVKPNKEGIREFPCLRVSELMSWCCGCRCRGVTVNCLILLPTRGISIFYPFLSFSLRFLDCIFFEDSELWDDARQCHELCFQRLQLHVVYDRVCILELLDNTGGHLVVGC
jgi:hypothetical protein